MLDPIIHSLLQGVWSHPSTGKRFRIPIDMVAIERDVVSKVPLFVSALYPEYAPLIVADKNTDSVVASRLAKVMEAPIHVFSQDIVATEEHAQTLVGAMEELGATMLVAVGSGTINDLCKYASHLQGGVYVCVATAPSMNGYCSSSASIEKNGYKTSLPAHLPKALFMDLDVLCQSPTRLIQSGFGDMVCRTTAQADWLLSHMVTDSSYSDVPFALLKGVEVELLQLGQHLMQRDVEAMKILAKALVLSGVGMYLMKGSYPASQAEHMIAHTIEMMNVSGIKKTYHGEQIAVTTLAMMARQSELLNSERTPVVKFSDESEQIKKLNEYFDPVVTGQSMEAYAKKFEDDHRIETYNETLANQWADIAAKIKMQCLKRSVVKRSLQSIGAPILNTDLGWDDHVFKKAIEIAPLTRDRFTFLDIK